MKSLKAFLVSVFLFSAVIIMGFIGHATAGDCGCGAEPDGGWGAPDYSDDPSWGSSFDDLTGGGGSGGSSSDTSGGGSSTSGDTDTSSSGSDSGGSSTGGSSLSSDSSSSSSLSGGSSEEGVVWRMKADDLYAKGLYNESLAAYNKSIGYDPYTIKSWIGKGKVLIALGSPSEAVGAFSQALKLDPGNADILVLLGDAQNASGSYDDAVKNYTRALTMNPNLVIVHDKIALVEVARTASSATLNTSAVVEATDIPTPEETLALVNTSSTITTGGANTAPFPGIAVVLLALGLGSVLLAIRKK